MIIAAMVAGAFVCVALGLVLGEVVFAHVALGISLFGIAVLAATLIHRRRRAETGMSGPVESDPDDQPDRPVEVTSPERQTPDADGESATEAVVTPDHEEALQIDSAINDASVAPGRKTEDSTDASLVHVVPGRRRFHLAGCGLLDGHADEQITLDEAYEEGFSACTTCTPHGTTPVRG